MVEVGDCVRRRGDTSGSTGDVVDVFAAYGEQWGLVSWRLRGNQYSGSRTLFRAELLRALIVVRSKARSGRCRGKGGSRAAVGES